MQRGSRTKSVEFEDDRQITFLSGVDNWEVGGSIEHHPMDDERNIDQDGVDLKEQFHDDEKVIPRYSSNGRRSGDRDGEATDESREDRDKASLNYSCLAPFQSDFYLSNELFLILSDCLGGVLSC